MRLGAALCILLFAAAQARAGESCPSRLTDYSLSALVERALTQGAIRLEDVAAMAESKEPLNPLEGVALDSTNSALFRVFETYRTLPEKWAAERVKLAKLLEESGGRAKARSDAREATATLIALRPLAEADGGVYPIHWLVTPAYEIYYAINHRDRIEIHDLRRTLSLEVPWVLKENASEPFYLGVDGDSQPQICMLKLPRRDWRNPLGIWRKNARTIECTNLKTKAVTKRAAAAGDLLNFSKRDDFRFDVLSRHPEDARAHAFKTGMRFVQTTAALRTKRGRLLVAIASQQPGGRLLEVFAPEEAGERAIFRAPYDSSTPEFNLTLFEREERVYLVADAKLGFTDIYLPLESRDRLLRAPLSWRKTLYWDVIQDGEGQVYFAGIDTTRAKLQIFEMFVRPD